MDNLNSLRMRWKKVIGRRKRGKAKENGSRIVTLDSIGLWRGVHDASIMSLWH